MSVMFMTLDVPATFNEISIYTHHFFIGEISWRLSLFSHGWSQTSGFMPVVGRTQGAVAMLAAAPHGVTPGGLVEINKWSLMYVE